MTPHQRSSHLHLPYAQRGTLPLRKLPGASAPRRQTPGNRHLEERCPFTATQLDAYFLRGSLLLRKLQGASAPPTNIRRATCTSIETSPFQPTRQKGRCCAQQWGLRLLFLLVGRWANQDLHRFRLRPRTLTPRYEELSHHLGAQPVKSHYALSWCPGLFPYTLSCFPSNHGVPELTSFYKWAPTSFQESS